jgi:tRNA U34 5-carboxymethylaminomethyl modifying GTPase MnmE/TrmE
MSMLKPANRHELLEVFSAVGVKFEDVRKDIKSREYAIKSRLDAVKEKISADPMSANSLPLDHPLRQAITASFAEIQNQLNHWVDDVNTYDKGTEFRAKYGDSLLIFVYGKVKAGKSSLGNYLAYGKSKPDSETKTMATPKPNFFLEADSGASEAMTAERMNEQQQFGVGAIETTSSIQGFTLPGLTWIDSPGVHSLTPENGKLAEKYASSADLIVFLSNSTSPGRRSDLEEISGLLRQGKPLVVLLSASDTIEEDEDREGRVIRQTVMKSEQDREAQITYVQGELYSLSSELRGNLIDTRVYPISVNYVESGSDSERWQDSGFASFSERVATIAEDQGLALKRETPLRNLLSFCEKLDISKEKMVGTLASVREKLVVERTEMRRKSEHILTTIRLDLSKKVENFADCYAMDDFKFKAACRNAYDESLNQAREDLFNELGQRLDQIAAQTYSSVAEEQDLPGFSKRIEKRSYKSSQNEKRGKAGGAAALATAGAYLGTLLFPGLGTAAGAAVGGLFGIIGGFIGEKVGGLAGEQFNSEQTTDIDLGDNRQEVSLATRKQLVNRAECEIKILSEKLDELCFAATEQWLEQVINLLANLSQEINTQKTLIYKELPESDQASAIDITDIKVQIKKEENPIMLLPDFARILNTYNRIKSPLNNWLPSGDADKLEKILIEKAKQMHPRIMVYGIYNAGKSTLLNALMGRAEAPMADRPTTAKIDAYQWQGYTLLDTPGIDAPEDDEEKTNTELDRCDVVLFVIATGGAIDEAKTWDTLVRIISRGRRVMLIVNNKQGIEPNSKDFFEIQNKLQCNLQDAAEKSNVKNVLDRVEIHLLNARSALKGRTENKPTLVEHSGILQLENALAEFLCSCDSFTTFNTCRNDLLENIQCAESAMQTKLGNTQTQALKKLEQRIEQERERLNCILNENLDRHLPIAKQKIISAINQSAHASDKCSAQIEMESAATEIASMVGERVNDDFSLEVAKTQKNLKDIGEILATELAAASASLNAPVEGNSSSIDSEESAVTKTLKETFQKMPIADLTEKGALLALKFGKEQLPSMFKGIGKVTMGRWAGTAGKLVGPVVQVGVFFYEIFQAHKAEQAQKKELERQAQSIENAANDFIRDLRIGYRSKISELTEKIFFPLEDWLTAELRKENILQGSIGAEQLLFDQARISLRAGTKNDQEMDVN